ncbi:MAG: hypothetical protein ACJ0Q6_02590 [Candidatus Azotimanducaceae bacterium]|nr:glycine zipper family protein [Gammaproteobacteria bacterium]
MKKFILFLVFVAGCADDPIVDNRGRSDARYQKDLAECRSLANKVNTGGKAAEQAAVGLAVGGVFGAVIGNSDSAQKAAGAGAVSGGMSGAAKAEERKKTILHRCLRGRGYKVLG